MDEHTFGTLNDDLASLASTAFRLETLNDICESGFASVSHAEAWFSHLSTILESEKRILDGIGKSIAECVPGAVYKPEDGYGDEED